MSAMFNDAMFSLASANYAAGEFSRNVIDQVKNRGNLKLAVKQINVAGVFIPYY